MVGDETSQGVKPTGYSKMLQAMYNISSGASAGIAGWFGGNKANPIKLNKRIKMSTVEKCIVLE